SVRDDPNNSLSNYMARLATITYDVIPRRVTLYSAVFGLGHLDSDTEMEPDIEMAEVDPEMDTNQVVAPVSAEVTKAATLEPMYIITDDSSASDPEQLLSPTANARQSLERLSLRSPQQTSRESDQELHQPSPNHFPRDSPERLPESSPELSPEPLPEQIPSPAQKRRIAPILITSELLATSTGNLVDDQQPFVLIPPPTLPPWEARQQLRS
ncbi:hypothetical protein GGI08_009312, partial [Coemansia sp. S2]